MCAMPVSNMKTPNIWGCREQILEEITFKLSIEGWIIALWERKKEASIKWERTPGKKKELLQRQKIISIGEDVE